MAKTRSTLNADVTPSSSVPSTQEVEISVKSGTAPVENLLVVDPTALNELKTETTEACKDIVDGRIQVFKRGMTIPGLPEEFYAHNGPYFRIPSVEVTDKGTIYVVADCRDKPLDQTKICIVAARSTDGGKNFEYKVIMERDTTSSGVDLSVSRVMDPTTVKGNGETVFVLAGKWIKGSGNWNQDSTSYNNWTSAATCILNDTNWNNSNFQVNYNFNPSTNRPNNLKGFLGGGSNGIKISNGKFILPVQYFVPGTGVKSSILISTDLSDWSWAVNGTPTTGGGECAIVEYEENKLELIVRADTKQVFRTGDLGATAWTTVNTTEMPVNITWGQCLHSYLRFKTYANQEIFLLANPQNEQGGFKRDQITVYHVDKKAGTNATIKAVKVLNYNIGGAPTDVDGSNFFGTWFGGYSSMAFSSQPNKDGEMLLIAYEDDVGVSLQNLTYLIPALENVGQMHDMANNTLTPEQLENIKNEVVDTAAPEIRTEVRNLVMAEVNTKVSAWPYDFTSFIDTHIIPENNQLEVIGSDLNSIGTLEISGGYLSSDGRVDRTKLSESDILPGGLYFNTPDATGYTIKGPVAVNQSANIISITFGLYIPSGASIKNYTPLIRFFNSPTDVSSNKGGLEITSDYKIFVTGVGNAGECPVLELDHVYTISAEFTQNGVKVYYDGELVKTVENNATRLNNLKQATHMCLVGQGSTDKYFVGHIGNVCVYDRELTEEEKKYGRWFTGRENGINDFNRISQVNTQVNAKVDETKESLLSMIRDLNLQVLRLRNPDVLYLNIPLNGFTTGAPSYGDIDASPYTLKLFKGKDEVSDIPEASGTENSDFGVYEGGLFIGKSVAPVAFKLGDETFTPTNKWTIKFKIRVLSSDFQQWKQLFYMSEDGANTATGNNLDNYNNTVKGSNSNKAFRLETSTTGKFTLMTYSGNNGAGACLSISDQNIGVYDVGVDYDYMISCDGTNVNFYGDNGKVINTFTGTPTFRIFGFNGLNFGSVLLKELKVLKGYAAKESELKIL